MRRHLVNLGALSAIQLANALLPVIVFPWVLSVIGPTLFARIAVTEAVTFFALAVVLFSFEVEGVAKIAGLDLKRDLARIAHIVSGILYVRIALLAVCVLLLLAAAPFVERPTLLLLLGWMMLPLGYVLQSMWLFQGLERNLALAVCVVGSRLLCLATLYLAVRAPHDYVLVPLIIGACYALGGAASLLYCRLVLKIRLVAVPPSELRALLLGGKEIFFGNLSVTLFRDSNVLILGALASPTAVSVYSIAEKLVKCFQAMARPLNQVMFPRVIRAIAAHSAPDRAAFRIILRYTLPQLMALMLGALCIALAWVLLRERLAGGAGGALTMQIALTVSLMAVAVLFGVSNFMFGSAGLNYLNQRGYFATAIFITGVCSVLLCIPLAYLWAERGAAATFLFSEVFLFILIARAYRRSPAGGAAAPGAAHP